MDHFDKYLYSITPRFGDVTYSILKAHLLFEELLNFYLSTSLPHPSALDGARLTFAQRLAIARASSTHVQPNHWIWNGISDLNKIRNMLSHEAQPKDLPGKISAYESYLIQHMKTPLPEPAFEVKRGDPKPTAGPLYLSVELLTAKLYYFTAVLLRIDLEKMSDRDEDLNKK